MKDGVPESSLEVGNSDWNSWERRLSVEDKPKGMEAPWGQAGVGAGFRLTGLRLHVKD